jgi:hypothetical protein
MTRTGRIALAIVSIPAGALILVAQAGSDDGDGYANLFIFFVLIVYVPLAALILILDRAARSSGKPSYRDVQKFVSRDDDEY